MTKKELGKIFEQYSSEELAESLVFPVRLNKKQKLESNAALKAALEKKRKEMSAEDSQAV